MVESALKLSCCPAYVIAREQMPLAKNFYTSTSHNLQVSKITESGKETRLAFALLPVLSNRIFFNMGDDAVAGSRADLPLVVEFS